MEFFLRKGIVFHDNKIIWFERSTGFPSYWYKEMPSAHDIRFQDELGWNGLSKYFPLERHYEETMQIRKKKKKNPYNKYINKWIK